MVKSQGTTLSKNSSSSDHERRRNLFLLYLFFACNAALDPNNPKEEDELVSPAGFGVINERLARRGVHLESIWEESLVHWRTLDATQSALLAVRVCADLKATQSRSGCQAVYGDLEAVAKADGPASERGTILLSKFKGQLGL